MQQQLLIQFVWLVVMAWANGDAKNEKSTMMLAYKCDNKRSCEWSGSMAQGDLCRANVGGPVEAVRENLIGIEVDWEG